MDSSSSPPAADGDLGKRLTRAERVLATFQQTLNHDLPNQTVAIQGLLQVLELEEGSRLSAEGLDYVRRLSALTRRIQEMLAAMKAIVRAGSEPGIAEEVSLAELAREVAAEIKQLFPDRTVTYHLRLQVPSLRVCRVPLQCTLVELCRTVLLENEGAESHLRLDARAAEGGVELSVGTWQEGPRLAVAPTGERAAVVNRLGLALAREFADAWGGTLRVTEDPERGKLFTVLLRPCEGPLGKP
jgi:signal transduction histidine kinase